MSYYKARAVGSDIDWNTYFEPTCASNVWSGFDDLSLVRPEVFCGNIWRYPLRSTPYFDAIITDPPYGLRKPRMKSGVHKDELAVSANEKQEAVKSIVEPLFQLAARLLVVGGRLVFLFPAFHCRGKMSTDPSDVELPEHECLRLVSFCVQQFKRMDRYCFTFEKIKHNNK